MRRVRADAAGGDSGKWGKRLTRVFAVRDQTIDSLKRRMGNHDTDISRPCRVNRGMPKNLLP